MQHKLTHSGQYHAYGDSFREYDIIFDADEEKTFEDVRQYCIDNNILADSKWNYEEWRKNDTNMDNHFAGYYTLNPNTTGYHLTICSPFAD